MPGPAMAARPVPAALQRDPARGPPYTGMMADSPSNPPSSLPPGSAGATALVLSGGGARAAYQAGVLRAIAELLPALEAVMVRRVNEQIAANRDCFNQRVIGL